MGLPSSISDLCTNIPMSHPINLGISQTKLNNRCNIFIEVYLTSCTPVTTWDKTITAFLFFHNSMKLWVIAEMSCTNKC